MTTILRAPPATVVLDGEIDIATSPAIRESLMAAINAGNVHLAVNMSGVAFIDAAGIGVNLAGAGWRRGPGIPPPERRCDSGYSFLPRRPHLRHSAA